MPTTRSMYRYHLMKGDKILHTGITHSPFWCLQEHRKKYGSGKDLRIKEVGYRTTPEEAMKWEEEQRQQGMPTAPKPH